MSDLLGVDENGVKAADKKPVAKKTVKKKATKKKTQLVEKKEQGKDKGNTKQFRVPELTDSVKRNIDAYCNDNNMAVERFFNEAIEAQLRVKQDTKVRVRFL